MLEQLFLGYDAIITFFMSQLTSAIQGNAATCRYQSRSAKVWVVPVKVFFRFCQRTLHETEAVNFKNICNGSVYSYLQTILLGQLNKYTDQVMQTCKHVSSKSPKFAFSLQFVSPKYGA